MKLVGFVTIIIILAVILILSFLLHVIIFVYSHNDKKCMGTIKVERLESGARTWAFYFDEGVDYDMIENMEEVKFRVKLKEKEDGN